MVENCDSASGGRRAEAVVLVGGGGGGGRVRRGSLHFRIQPVSEVNKRGRPTELPHT